VADSHEAQNQAASVDHILMEFDSRKMVLAELAAKVQDLLKQLLTERGLHVHEVNARLKDRASLENKIRRHDPPYGSLGEITDLVGTRVITLFADDVDRVADVVESEFKIDLPNSVDKRATIEPDRFGYLSLHYVGAISNSRILLPEWGRFADLKFEIQIRSILQHAWAEIEHDLGYHVEQAVPAPVRRRFSRLAGLLEVADSEFRGLRTDVDQYKVDIAALPKKDLAASPLDLETMTAYINTDPAVRELDGVVGARVGHVIGDVDHDYIGKRIEDFAFLGMSSIGDVQAAVAANAARFSKFVPAWLPEREDVEVPRGGSLWLLFLLLAADKRSAGPDIPLPARLKFSKRLIERLVQAHAAAVGDGETS
jgi:GTP pyrophosphokinase